MGHRNCESCRRNKYGAGKGLQEYSSVKLVQEYLQTLVYMTTGVLKRPPLENYVHVKSVLFVCVQVRLVRELEKKFSGRPVVFVAQRRILPKPKRNQRTRQKQLRPRRYVWHSEVEREEGGY